MEQMHGAAIYAATDDYMYWLAGLVSSFGERSSFRELVPLGIRSHHLGGTLGLADKWVKDDIRSHTHVHICFTNL